MSKSITIQKIYSKMYFTLYADTHHEVTPPFYADAMV